MLDFIILIIVCLFFVFLFWFIHYMKERDEKNRIYCKKCLYYSDNGKCGNERYAIFIETPIEKKIKVYGDCLTINKYYTCKGFSHTNIEVEN